MIDTIRPKINDFLIMHDAIRHETIIVKFQGYIMNGDNSVANIEAPYGLSVCNITNFIKNLGPSDWNKIKDEYTEYFV